MVSNAQQTANSKYIDNYIGKYISTRMNHYELTIYAALRTLRNNIYRYVTSWYCVTYVKILSSDLQKLKFSQLLWKLSTQNYAAINIAFR